MVTSFTVKKMRKKKTSFSTLGFFLAMDVPMGTPKIKVRKKIAYFTSAPSVAHDFL
jgi:hypothetical protein